MQRPIPVRLRERDVVLEATRDGRPDRVDLTEHRVAIRDAVDQYAHRTHIKQLMKLEVFALHFAPDTDDMFNPPFDPGFDFLFGNQRFQMLRKLLNKSFAFAAFHFE